MFKTGTTIFGDTTGHRFFFIHDRCRCRFRYNAYIGSTTFQRRMFRRTFGTKTGSRTAALASQKREIELVIHDGGGKTKREKKGRRRWGENKLESTGRSTAAAKKV